MANILSEARSNTAFRRVLFTGSRSQLVVMSLQPGEDIGEETHHNVEQLFFFVMGSGKVELDGVASKVAAGDALVVTPGTRHNVMNTGTEPLKLYTVYVPPNHIDGRVQATKKDAQNDKEDEQYGERVDESK